MYMGLRKAPGLVGTKSTSVALAPGSTCAVPPSSAWTTTGVVESRNANIAAPKRDPQRSIARTDSFDFGM